MDYAFDEEEDNEDLPDYGYDEKGED